MLCIPVIIQPLVEQAYHDMLPYSELALRYDPVDIEQLPELLQAIDSQTICRMRHAALRYRRLLVWDAPTGLAYDALQLLLCRRAVAWYRQQHRQSEPWMGCATTTADELLADWRVY